MVASSCAATLIGGKLLQAIKTFSNNIWNHVSLLLQLCLVELRSANGCQHERFKWFYALSEMIRGDEVKE